MANLQTTLIYQANVKESWGKGPWTTEADIITWIDDRTLLHCMIYRTEMGALCGYVGVDESSALHGSDYSEQPFSDVNIHGGLTHAGLLNRTAPEELQHLWWFGFDCAHAWDVIPAFNKLKFNVNVGGSKYRDVFYVSAQVRELAEQISRIAAHVRPLGIVRKIINKIANKE